MADGLRHLSNAKLKKLKAEIERDFRKAVEKQRKEEEDRYKPRTSRQTVGGCSCGGKIVRETKTSYKYFGDPMQMIIGPGHRDQLSQVVETETYCTSCKVLYSNSGKIEPKKKAAKSR